MIALIAHLLLAWLIVSIPAALIIARFMPADVADQDRIENHHHVGWYTGQAEQDHG